MHSSKIFKDNIIWRIYKVTLSFEWNQVRLDGVSKNPFRPISVFEVNRAVYFKNCRLEWHNLKTVKLLPLVLKSGTQPCISSWNKQSLKQLNSFKTFPNHSVELGEQSYVKIFSNLHTPVQFSNQWPLNCDPFSLIWEAIILVSNRALTDSADWDMVVSHWGS